MRLVARFTDDPPPTWFSLVWEHEGACFPYVGHMDFGIDLLGQWTVGVRELLRGNADTVDLVYIEGEHRLTVSRIDEGGDDCVVIPQDVEPAPAWPTTVRDLARTILETGDTLCAHLETPPELATDLARLRELLA